MLDRKDTDQIHLVSTWHRVKIAREDFATEGTQGELFPVCRSRMVIFVHFPDVTEQEFCEIVDYAEPSHVVELRASPRFDIGGLDRQSAFKTFERRRIIYCDLTSSLMGSTDSETLLSNLKNFFNLSKPQFDKPIVFLTSPQEEAKGILDQVLDTCVQFGYSPNSVYRVPRFV